MNGLTSKRLNQELMKFMTDPPPGLSASLTDEENIYKWHALIYAPKNTPFENGTFRVEIAFPQNYPASPPRVQFLSKMFHPNVYPKGNVCMDSLGQKWRDSYQAADILNIILVLLGDPNVRSPANPEASELFKKHPGDSSYQTRVKTVVNMSETYNPRFGADANKNYNL